LVGVDDRGGRIGAPTVGTYHVGQSVEPIDGKPPDNYGRPRIAEAIPQLHDYIFGSTQLLREGHRQPMRSGFHITA